MSLTVHTVRATGLDDLARRTRSGRMKMLLVLAICAAPVVASYITYFFVRPKGRTNYSELVEPQRPMPADLPLLSLQGKSVAAQTLKGQWLLIVVAGGACDTLCERHLWLQRQLREALGRDKDRVDKVWLISDAAVPSARTLSAITTNTEADILRVPARALANWLEPSVGHALEDNMYIVDPMGNWMMRVSPDPDPVKLKQDLVKLLGASAGWDKPER